MASRGCLIMRCNSGNAHFEIL